MPKETHFEAAFVLHSRPFRDTSLLVDLLTRDNGRKTIIAKGVRKARSLSCGLLQPFVPLMVSLSGKTDLLNLRKVEANGLPYDLQGRSLLIGFYLNELLMKLLHKYDAHQNIYFNYEKALTVINDNHNDNLKQQSILRIFELELIKELGYGLILNKDVNGNEILVNEYYYFDYGEGFMATGQDNYLESNKFSGASLQAFYSGSLLNATELRDAKRLMQMVLAKLLNGKVIKTRELF